MPGVNTNPVGSVAAARPPQNALLRGVLGKLSLKDVRNAPSFSRCQLGRTPGIHEQTSHGDAIGYAHDVMKEAMQTASRNDAKALGRTLELLSYGTNDNLGPVLLVHLTAIGAVREGVAALLRESPGDEKLATHLKQLDDAIVKTGIKAGKCELAEPDAVYLAQYPTTEKVCDAVAAGKKVMTQCAAKIGGPALLAGIAQAVLPQAMMDSLAERLPERADTFLKTEGVPEWSEVLQAQAAWHLNKVLKSQLESGGTEDLQSAVIQLLKTPEYILRSQRGGEGDDSDGLRSPDVPADAPAWVKQGVKDGAPILYNVVNCGGNSQSSGSHRCGVQLDQIRNLLNDAREDSYERGRLTEIVRFQEHHIDRLERELQAERERNGPGEVRARKLQNEQLDNASAGTLPLDEELDLIPDLDVGQVPVDLTHTGIDQIDNSERVPQRREQLNNASNEVLPSDSDLDQIKPGDRARAFARNQTGGTDRIDHPSHQRRVQVHSPSNGVIPPDGSLDRTPDQGNGEGLVRHELAGEDRTDRSNRPPPQSVLRSGSNGVVPPDEDLGSIPPLDSGRNRASLQADDTDHTESSNRRDHQQQLGDAQRLVQRPSGRLDTGGVAPFDDTAVVGEFERYLQALGREQTPRPLDPLQPVGPRNMVSNGDAEPSIKASDFTGYRDDRTLLSGAPFVPIRTGRVGAPVDTVKPELIKLIDKHGAGNLSPKHVLEETRLRPAKATPVAIRSPDTELDRAFASMRKKRMEALYPATTATAGAAPPRSPSPQSGPSPAAQSAGTGTIASLLSFANAVSSSDGVFPTRADVLADSRAPRGEQKGQAGAERELHMARTTPALGSDVTHIVKIPDEASQPRLEGDARGRASRAASSLSSLSQSSSSASLDSRALEEWWAGIAEREPTNDAVQAWQRASFGNASPLPDDAQPLQDEGSVNGSVDALERTFNTVTSARSIDEAAREQFARMVMTNHTGESVEEPYMWSSGPAPTSTLQREVSADSADSGNESPTRPKDDNWILRPVKPISIPMSQPVKTLQRTYIDLSFLNASEMERRDPATTARPQRIASDEHHEDVVQPASKGITDETPATSRATQPSPAKALKTPASVMQTRHADEMEALIQELTESFQKRAAAQAAT